MHKAHAKRIAWFLMLRRILRFSKHFLAPQVAPLRRHRALPSESAGGGATKSPDAGGPSFTAPASRNLALKYQGPRTSDGLLNRPGLPPVLRTNAPPMM